MQPEYSIGIAWNNNNPGNKDVQHKYWRPSRLLPFISRELATCVHVGPRRRLITRILLRNASSRLVYSGFVSASLQFQRIEGFPLQRVRASLAVSSDACFIAFLITLPVPWIFSVSIGTRAWYFATSFRCKIRVN